MNQVIDVSSLFINSTDVCITKCFYKDSLIFLEPNYNESMSSLTYTNLYKVNYESREISKHTFNLPADVVSFTATQTTFFYAHCIKHGRDYIISIKKINCNDWKEEEILSLKIECKGNNNVGDLLRDSVIVGLNDRYAVIWIPSQFQESPEEPFFDKVLLIDSHDKSVYTVPDKVGKADTLLRMDEVWEITQNNNQYLIIKTGRIRAWEKREFWKQKNREQIYEQNQELIESFVVLNVDKFISNVKSGVNIEEEYGSLTCDQQSCITLIGIENDIIIFSKQNFSTKTIDILFYNITSKTLISNRYCGLYEEIYYSNSKLYGVLTKKGLNNIYDILEKKKMFSVKDEKVACIVNNNIVTFKPAKLAKFQIKIYNIDNQTITKIHGERFFEIVPETKMLVLF